MTFQANVKVPAVVGASRAGTLVVVKAATRLGAGRLCSFGHVTGTRLYLFFALMRE